MEEICCNHQFEFFEALRLRKSTMRRYTKLDSQDNPCPVGCECLGGISSGLTDGMAKGLEAIGRVRKHVTPK
jgi:hypothetical protein